MFSTRTVLSDLKRSSFSFSILAIGLFYLIIQFTLLSIAPSSPVMGPFFLFQLVTITTTLALVFSGIFLYKTNLSDKNILKITLWVGFGVFLGILITELNILLQQHYETTVYFENMLVINNSSLSGFFGLLIGFYHANGSEKANQMENEKKENELLHSLLTHDLRNKLQIMEGKLHLLKEKEDLNNEQEEIIDTSLETSKKIIDLSDKVRKAMKTSAKKRTMKKAEIKEIITEEIEDKKEKNGFDLFFVDNADDSEVIAGGLVEEVFRNLLENALIHSEGDEVIVVLNESKSNFIIGIDDNGKGIPDGKKEKIFELDYTETGASAGFGLFLIKKVVERYGGSVEVRDSHLGGARFDIFLRKNN